RQDRRDARARGKFHQAGQQRRYRGGGSALHHELAPFHDPDHRVEDLAIWQRDDLIDEPLDDREVDLADPAHPQAVDDRPAVDRLKPTALDALLHRGPVRCPAPNHANFWTESLSRHRSSGDQPPAPDWDDYRLHLGPVLHNLETESPLACDQLLIV